ncbi:hypothetical protein [Lentiprolixibacter aurantiacus]|uniref:Uncharacterized protein n=1 Tax=Lentiprolixibacter aurantiacus TaxID=2993939 RepID=A0AAE3SPC3_9FLAO|nr:hypothetical protein [Lentiprolixibacter aurantiacus]MCX2720539.1 hypothetical protein [Lentiprolixibacter aurantiacus]
MKTLLHLSFILSFALFSIQFALAQEKDCACCTENHSAFDFWIGDWEVFLPDGSVAGYNTIAKIQDKCALQEKWTSAKRDFKGTSYNYYNQTSGQWEQLWIDNAGTQLKLYGNRIGNQMILSSEAFKGPDGGMYINRITWTANPDGTVRQHWEVLQGENVVQVAFDGLYRKKTPSGE